MASLEAEVDAVAEATAFSGVVRVDRAEGLALAKAYGAADRANAIANTVDTRFGIASGSKGMTALAVMSLVQDGTLTLRTTARSVLGADLPLIADDVTVEHLLAHRSGIGDYLDEEADVEVTDYLMTVPVQHLARTEDFLAVLDGFPTVSPAGERFTYNNGGYVVLALIAERASGVPFHDLVRDRVCAPAGMTTAAYLRSDELPGGVALGYLTVDQPRTNIFHLPVRGNGDGGMYATVADFAAFWSALFAGAIVPRERVAEMVRPRSVEEDGSRRYGIGFWLHANTDVVWLEGHDAGVSFCSVHDPVATITHTVISNTSEGAWPVSIRLDQILGT